MSNPLLDDASIGGLNDLLDAIATLDTSGAADWGDLWELENHVVGPLVVAVERALEWLSDIESALVADGVATAGWQPLAEACFVGRSELESVLDELGDLAVASASAGERCRSAIARAKQAISIVVVATERHCLDAGQPPRSVSKLTEELRESPLGKELAATVDVSTLRRRHPGAQFAHGTKEPELQEAKAMAKTDGAGDDAAGKVSHEYFTLHGIRFERTRKRTDEEPAWDVGNLDDAELR